MHVTHLLDPLLCHVLGAWQLRGWEVTQHCHLAHQCGVGECQQAEQLINQQAVAAVGVLELQDLHCKQPVAGAEALRSAAGAVNLQHKHKHKAKATQARCERASCTLTHNPVAAEPPSN